MKYLIGVSLTFLALAFYAPMTSAQDNTQDSAAEQQQAKPQSDAKATEAKDAKDAKPATPKGDKEAAKIETEKKPPADLFDSIERDVESGDFYQSCSPPVG